MRLTGPQIEAAMALAGVTREAMCKHAKIAKNTLNDILNNKSAYREETIKKISSILEMRGIEFLPAEGVRRKDRIITTYEGDGANQSLLDDIYSTLKDTGGEVLVANVDEGRTIDHLSRAVLEKHLERLKKANITERLLVRSGDANLVAPLEFYHVLPEEYFSEYPFFVYGPKLGLVSRQPSPKVVIINDERFSDSVRKLFNYVWERTEKPVLKGT